jgi:hypothetical protein
MESEKDNLLRGRTITEVSKIIGISNKWLGDILSARKGTIKITAYCIAKEISPDYEIKDCFEVIKNKEE